METILTNYSDVLKIIFLIVLVLIILLGWYINTPIRHKNLGFTKDSDSLQRQLDRIALEIMNNKQ